MVLNLIPRIENIDENTKKLGKLRVNVYITMLYQILLVKTDHFLPLKCHQVFGA